MILDPGCRVLIAHRRLYENDGPRFFVGTVDGYEAGVARVTGYSWVRDIFSGVFVKKTDIRTKIIALSSGTLIAYELPTDLDIARLKFEFSENRTWLTNGGPFRMDLSEVEHTITKGSAHR